MDLGDLSVTLSADLQIEQMADGRLAAVGEGHLRFANGNSLTVPIHIDVTAQAAGDSSPS